MSTGTTSTASAPWLLLTGFSIVGLGALSLVPTYIITWTLDQFLHPAQISLVGVLLNISIPTAPALSAVSQIVVNTISFLSFLILLRLSPLAGYHAAEHKTVNAIERYGVHGWEPHVEQMPRAHRRCGSNLLAGIIPVLLVAVPLFAVSPTIAIILTAASWLMRRRLGFFLQRTFTTKEPTADQLQKGIEAGRKVLSRWLEGPQQRPVLAVRLWRRGMPQMVVGVICAVSAMGWIADQLPMWLDW